MKNILAENMRRFGTKNLAEGWGDVLTLTTYMSEFRTILKPGQTQGVIYRTIQRMIIDMGGPGEAADLIQGAMQSFDRVKSFVKPFIADDAELDVKVLDQVIESLPFDEAIKKQLKDNIIRLAQELNVGIYEEQPEVDADTSTGPKLA
jgi:hypothetical protein